MGFSLTRNKKKIKENCQEMVRNIFTRKKMYRSDQVSKGLRVRP